MEGFPWWWILVSSVGGIVLGVSYFLLVTWLAIRVAMRDIPEDER